MISAPLINSNPSKAALRPSKIKWLKCISQNKTHQEQDSWDLDGTPIKNHSLNNVGGFNNLFQVKVLDPKHYYYISRRGACTLRMSQGGLSLELGSTNEWKSTWLHKDSCANLHVCPCSPLNGCIISLGTLHWAARPSHQQTAVTGFQSSDGLPKLEHYS